ncbi:MULTISPECIES: CdaR family protein [unclassified Pseudodesulfovibrio]|uniref:CdaR family protein n=1 Tax=unclassified Pseudodesulfovibrio TaxID=2661612 RepID=UPI000FEB6748|nr:MULTISPECIES: CdaR family protein [unclassified Pseudodesulfovibrio]MCJ2164250.1 CdaR family protein [Pseudodesulfovibrio sp. S3-i]RWU05127.1 YbbR-like domain-containing protein [Pseudodesulfovibrio sp. S3]
MKNWQTVILSIALAVFTWFLVTGREVVETWVDMPLVMTNPPEGLIIEDGLVDKIQVRLRGPKGLVGNLSSQNLTYPVNVSDLKIGERVVDIETSKIPLSSTYEIIEVKPNRLKLKVDRRISKEIHVEAAWAGNLNADYKLQEVLAVPDLVVIRGPETMLRKITSARVVLNEDFPEDVPKSWAEDVALELPAKIEASPGQVRVEAFFTPKTRQIWVKVPLEFHEPGGYKATVSQQYVRLLIEGPVFLFHDDEYRKAIGASLTFGTTMAPGTFELDYDVTLPDGCRLEKRNPETVTTTLKKG